MTLTCVTLALFLPVDLIWGGVRSINTRYMIPCYLRMQIAVAYFLAVKMTSPQVTMQLQKLWRVARAALLSIGIISCCIYLPANSWRNKDRSYINIRIARTVNSASKPLIITEFPEYNVDTIGNLLGMSHQIAPTAKLLLMSPKNVEIYGNFTAVSWDSIFHEFKTLISQLNYYKNTTILAKKHEMLFRKIVNK